MTPRLEEELRVPQDHDAERSFLATIILSPNSPEVQEALQVLAPDHFVDHRHAALFKSFQVLHSTGVEIDPLSVKAELERDGKLAKVGGYTWIVDLCQALEVDHPARLAERIRELWTRRRIMKGASRLLQDASDLSIPTQELMEQLECVQEECTAIPGERGARRPLIDYVLDGPGLAAERFPVREALVDPWLTTASLSMVYAPTGVGKSWFVMEEIRALTTGQPFLHWNTSGPRRALYIDGELPGAVIQERFALLYGSAPTDLLTVLPSEFLWLDGCPLDLSTSEGQSRINHLLTDLEQRGQRPDLVVIDNLSTLSSGDENDNTAQYGVMSWLMSMRHRQYAVQLVHHTGKSGDQRGASRRKDNLDAVISLTDAGAGRLGFKVEFVKWRCKSRPEDSTWTLDKGKHDEAIWMPLEPSLTSWQQALVLIREKQPANATRLGVLMGISRQAAEKHIKALRGKSHLKPDSLELTPQGMRLAEELRAKEER